MLKLNHVQLWHVVVMEIQHDDVVRIVNHITNLSQVLLELQVIDHVSREHDIRYDLILHSVANKIQILRYLVNVMTLSTLVRSVNVKQVIHMVLLGVLTLEIQERGDVQELLIEPILLLMHVAIHILLLLLMVSVIIVFHDDVVLVLHPILMQVIHDVKSQYSDLVLVTGIRIIVAILIILRVQYLIMVHVIIVVSFNAIVVLLLLVW